VCEQPSSLAGELKMSDIKEHYLCQIYKLKRKMLTAYLMEDFEKGDQLRITITKMEDFAKGHSWLK
jgi:hypothetical protein